MQFETDSGVIVKRLLPSFKKCKPNTKKGLKGITDALYVGFSEGEKYYRSRISPVKANVRANGNITYPNMFGHHFMPTNVKEYIGEKIAYQLEYQCKILERNITIRIGLFTADELMKLDKYEQYVSFMCIWLYNCIQNAGTGFGSASCKQLTIYFYPTTMKKKLPSRKADVIGVEHVNSALTFRCTRNTSDIIIYRLEEWKKVFIHETFHTFGFDIQPHIETDVHALLETKFNVRTKLSVSEAYTETWARIINAAYASYHSTQKNGEGPEQFSIYLDFSLQMERMFSLLQMHKILGFLDMNYRGLWKTRKGERSTKSSSLIPYEKHVTYKEDPNTNAFGYYIVTAILMNGYAEFMLWCGQHNTSGSLLKFPGTSLISREFVKMIEKCFHKEQCDLNGVFTVDKRDRFLKKTARMSAIELFD